MPTPAHDASRAQPTCELPTQVYPPQLTPATNPHPHLKYSGGPQGRTSPTHSGCSANHFLLGAFPASAARLYHRRASTKSAGTPKPFSESCATPRIPAAIFISAALRYHSSALASSRATPAPSDTDPPAPSSPA